MGLNQFFRRQQKEKQEDFESRAKQFAEEYQLLVRKYGIDIGATLDFIDGGRGGIIPRGQFIDVKGQLKVEEERSKIKTENKD